MRTLLLLLISLMTGRDAAADEGRCSETWAQCKYPEDRRYQRIDVAHQSHTGSSNETNAWENKGTFFLYHDTRDERLRVVFTQSHKETDGFQCHFYQETTSEPEKRNLEKSKCKTHLDTTQTYSSATTSITCGRHQSGVRFFCKQVGSGCENILSASPQASNSRFRLSAGIVSIRDVSSQDQGFYWCGAGEGSQAALRKIRLEVQDIPVHKKSFSVGQTLTHWCRYTTNAGDEKFLCKGGDPSGCERVVSSSGSGRFTIQDDAGKRNMTITMRSLRAEDAGTYWCGAESTSRTRRTSRTSRAVIFGRLDLDPTEVTSTSSAPQGGLAGLTAALVSVAVLLLVLSLVWVYKHFKNTTTGEVQANKEEHGYAEIQERPPTLDSGTAMHTTYVTATFPTNPSAFLHGSSDPAGAGDAVYWTIDLPQT